MFLLSSCFPCIRGSSDTHSLHRLTFHPRRRSAKTPSRGGRLTIERMEQKKKSYLGTSPHRADQVSNGIKNDLSFFSRRDLYFLIQPPRGLNHLSLPPPSPPPSYPPVPPLPNRFTFSSSAVVASPHLPQHVLGRRWSAKGDMVWLEYLGNEHNTLPSHTTTPALSVTVPPHNHALHTEQHRPSRFSAVMAILILPSTSYLPLSCFHREHFLTYFLVFLQVYTYRSLRSSALQWFRNPWNVNRI